MVTNRTHERGAAMLIFILFFLFAGSALSFLLARGTFSDASILNSLTRSTHAYLAAESVAEDVVYRTITGMTVNTVERFSLFGTATATATTTVDAANDEYIIDVAGDAYRSVRKVQVRLTLGAGSAFNYGLQSGTGGITMANSTSVVGNVYSNGPIQGQGNSRVRGDAVSAGPSGSIFNVHATGSARAHRIQNSTIDGNLYVASVSDDIANTVNGTRYHSEPDQPPVSLPIDNATVDEWKQAVIDHGTTVSAASCASGTYTIDFNTTIGYLRVPCNLDIRKKGASTIVNVNGPVWVEGNLSFTQGPTIRVPASLGRRSVQFIADRPSNRTTSSRIEVRNSTSFSGSGDPRSIVLLLSRNTSASLGGTQKAIDVAQSATGDVMVYAGEGLIDIGNGVDLKEVTAYQINLAQNSDIFYDSGLANLLFTAGPGGGYILSDWRETY